ncbi:hypothetical protein ROA7450_00290 [Roseovarius albus]|uniref:Lipoprotein n=1 Tax=Roseovarius albus TaxID=1247867 RepID=A0A1X6YA85_9RHOB|nr:hypothetical protein [Roseovarius albus]SLN14600.1 hypothetical protein ROA7450_00290 [Roseovarius albus]
MKHYVAMALSLVLLNACTSADPDVAKKQHLRAKADAVNVKFSDPALIKTVVGFRGVNFTTTRPDANETIGVDKGVDVNSSCKIQASGYSADFTTPAVVNMPSFGKYTQNAKLSCTYNDREYSKTLKPHNPSKSSRKGAAVAVGLLVCSACGGIMLAEAGGTREDDILVFEDVELEVR